MIDSTIMVQHLGVVYFLMSFIGCVRSLMEESGLVDIQSSAFCGVDHMFTGNKCPQNVRALRLLVETVTQNTVQEANAHHDKIQRNKNTFTRKHNLNITHNVQTNISMVYVVY